MFKSLMNQNTNNFFSYLKLNIQFNKFMFRLISNRNTGSDRVV